MQLIPRTACDLHLHSSASGTNDEWYGKTFGCPESYASPLAQYERCKARGMSLVTLTDHDTIAGGLELIDRPDFFLSEEVTTVFPEDGCAIHVLAWHITPAQHDVIQAARGSVYDLVDVLRRERITHACAHPLFSPNWKLSVAALEKILVLFPVLEGVNGLTDRRLETDLAGLLAGLDDEAIATLARRHGLEAVLGRRRVLAAGSDDHVTRHCASCFTEADGELGPAELLAALTDGRARCQGRSADLHAMQLAATRVTFDFLDSRKLERPSYRDPFLDLIETVSGTRSADAPTSSADELVRSFIAGAARSATPLGRSLDPANVDDHGDAANARVIEGITAVHDGLIGRAFDELIDGVGDLDMYRVLGGVRDLGGAIATAVPLLFAADHFARQRVQATRVLAGWQVSPRPEPTTRLAMFSDTLDHVDGVSTSVRRFVRQARVHGHEVRIPYCGVRPADDGDGGVYLPVPCATTLETGLYSGLELHLPSLLGTVDWLWRNEITHVELATPGPMGLVGLAAARLLRLSVTASYHTELTLLMRQLSTSPLLASCARRLSAWFYGAVDTVFAFSQSSRQRLIELGVPEHKIQDVAVAIDPGEFSPHNACREIYRSFGVPYDRHDRIVLTVGRLSPEKNVRLIVDAVTRLQTSAHPPVLVVVGDGPERPALEAMCRDRPFVVFVGTQQGETLKRLYATASAFVFASRIDTLGLVAMEAMSSGVPVLVPSDAAIAELVIDGVSGVSYEFGLDGLVGALGPVLANPATRARIAANARTAMVERWARARFTDRWNALTAG